MIDCMLASVYFRISLKGRQTPSARILDGANTNPRGNPILNNIGKAYYKPIAKGFYSQCHMYPLHQAESLSHCDIFRAILKHRTEQTGLDQYTNLWNGLK